MDPDVAALIIQKNWKGYSQRKKTSKIRDDELIFIGMQPNPVSLTDYKDAPMNRVKKREVCYQSKSSKEQ